MSEKKKWKEIFSQLKELTEQRKIKWSGNRDLNNRFEAQVSPEFKLVLGSNHLYLYHLGKVKTKFTNVKQCSELFEMVTEQRAEEVEKALTDLQKTLERKN